MIEIRLELDPDSDPISGRLHDPRGGVVAFGGWMQLMAAVEATRQDPSQSTIQPLPGSRRPRTAGGDEGRR